MTTVRTTMDSLDELLSNLEAISRAKEDIPSTIDAKMCAAPPFGCGNKVVMSDFRDDLSKKDYFITALCQNCQDKIYKEPEDE